MSKNSLLALKKQLEEELKELNQEFSDIGFKSEKTGWRQNLEFLGYIHSPIYSLHNCDRRINIAKQQRLQERLENIEALLELSK